MLLSNIKKYIKEKSAVSLTELSLEFGIDRESLEGPLKLLVDKGLIKIEKSLDSSPGSSKCSGCPMACKPKEIEKCKPSSNFNIYTWVEN